MNERHFKKIKWTDEEYQQLQELNYKNSLENLKNYIDERGEIIKPIPASLRRNYRNDGILIREKRIINRNPIRKCITIQSKTNKVTAQFLVLTEKTKRDLGLK